MNIRIIRRFVPLVGLVLACAIPAWACSIPLGADAKQLVGIPSEPFLHTFVAEVVDEEVVDDPRNVGRKLVASLRFKVIESSSAAVPVGGFVALGSRYTGAVGAGCERVAENLTLRDWPAGTRVRVQTNDLYAAERMYRID